MDIIHRTTVLILLLLFCAQSVTVGAPVVKKLRDIIIYQDKTYYSAFPSLIVRKSGEILCAFRRAPDRRLLWNASSYTHTDPNSYLVLVRSKDAGKTWTKEPELIFAHPLGGSQDPCLVQLADGSIVCSSYGWALAPSESAEKLKVSPAHSSYRFLGGYIVRSDDGGKSWDGPFIPMAVPGGSTKNALGNPCPAYNRGAMIQGKDSKLYWAVASQEKQKPGLTSVHLLTSPDKATTWHYNCPIATDEKVTFNETSLIETRKGDIIAFMRTDNFDGKLAYSRSIDEGKSFGPWKDGGFFGHPFHAIHLKDGRIFLVYGYRKPPFGIRAKVLNPECTDIADAPETIIRDDGGSGDIGYPWAALLPNGNVLIAYYFNLKDGTRYIAGSVLSVR